MVLKTIGSALDVVNRTRQKLGLEPLDRIQPGAAANPLFCPLANSLPDDAFVGTRQVRFKDEASARALARSLNRKAIYDPDLSDNTDGTGGWGTPKEDKAGRARPWKVVTKGTALEEFVHQFDRQVHQVFRDLKCRIVDARKA